MAEIFLTQLAALIYPDDISNFLLFLATKWFLAWKWEFLGKITVFGKQVNSRLDFGANFCCLFLIKLGWVRFWVYNCCV